MSLRRDVAELAHGRCEYCQSPEAYSSTTYCLEHIEPLSAGGVTCLENIAFACQGCNGFKGDKTAVWDASCRKAVRLFHPRRDRWARHFAWSENGLEMVPKTLIARLTITTLKLNRPALRNLRRVLMQSMIHPPE